MFSGDISLSALNSLSSILFHPCLFLVNLRLLKKIGHSYLNKRKHKIKNKNIIYFTVCNKILTETIYTSKHTLHSCKQINS